MLAGVAAEEQPAPAQMPDLDFLEFLGEWETADGDWFDPSTLEEPLFSDFVDEEQGLQDGE